MKLCCSPSWVDEGQHVWVLWQRANRSALRCVVAVAAGKHARVTNEQRGFDRWLPLDALLVEHDDPRGSHPASVAVFFGPAEVAS